MGTNYSTTDGLSTERDKLYYAERARGGVAHDHDRSDGRHRARSAAPQLAVLLSRPLHSGSRDHRRRDQAHDASCSRNSIIAAGLLRRSVLNMEPVGPSPWKNPNTGDAVRPLTVPEIVEIQKLFVASARRLQQAGYDARRDSCGQRLSFPAVLHAAHQQAHGSLWRLVR